MVDRRCRESEGKAKIEGYMSISDEEAHQRSSSSPVTSMCVKTSSRFCLTGTGSVSILMIRRLLVASHT